MFDWAVNCFKNVSFDFCTSEAHQAHENLYQSQHQNCKTISKTSLFHAFVTEEKKLLLCKIFSSSEKNSNYKKNRRNNISTRVKTVFLQKNNVYSLNLKSYINI